MSFPSPPGFLADLLGLDESWEDRIQEAAYTTPSGTRITFEYEDVSRKTPLRSTAFSFPLVEGDYVQQNGIGSRKYPLLCYFTGSNHDRIAAAFEAGLFEHGTGQLEHPLYGTFDVVPFGEVTRRDDLKSAANQTVVEVEFWMTIGALYPSEQDSPENEILASIDAFDVAAAQEFDDSMSLLTEVNKATSAATMRKFLGDISASLTSVSQSVESVNRKFRDAQSLVNNGLDVLIGQPLLLAQQTINLTRAPARALDGIISRIEAYAALAERIFGSEAGSASTSIGADSEVEFLQIKTKNDHHMADLIASSATASSVVSAVETTYTTRSQAIAAAEAVLQQVDDLTAWREEQLEAIGEVDPGGAFQALQEAAALTAGFLIQISFTLLPERAIVLDRNRTIVDVAAELYGSVDDRLDFLIDSNNLSGSEILELPRGKKIVFYA